MKKTKIEWCDCTINPVVGCTYGCKYCYARRMNERFGWILDFSKPQFFPERLEQLYSKKPQVIFMNSMSDIADWEHEWIIDTFKAMEENPQHKYIFLTKRPQIYEKILTRHTPSNWWFGTTQEKPDMGRKSTVHHSVNVFFSIEPILADFPNFMPNTEWVIIGAETGNRKGKVVPKKEWIDNIVMSCDEKEIPVFMKDSLVPIVGEENMRREFPWRMLIKTLVK